MRAVITNAEKIAERLYTSASLFLANNRKVCWKSNDSIPLDATVFPLEKSCYLTLLDSHPTY